MENAETTITSLIDSLGHPDARIRRRAADALGKLGTSAMPALMKALKNGNSRVRAGAADAIKRMGAKGSAAIDLLIEALKDEDQEVASNAAGALGAFGPVARAAVPALIEALSGLSADAAVKALRQLRTVAKPALLEAIDHRNYSVSRRAAEALWTLDSHAAPSLLASVRDPDLRARRGATRALGNMRGLSLSPQAVLALLEALTDQDSRVRGNAALALVGAQHEVNSVVWALTVALGDEDENVRANAIDALGSLGEAAEPAIPKLILLTIKHWAPDVRTRAVETLVRLGPVAVRALVKEVKQPDSVFGWEAAKILERIGPPAKVGLPGLIEALQHENEGVRLRCSACLVAIGSEAAPSLIKLLKEPDQRLRKDVTKTLLAIDRVLLNREEEIKEITDWRNHLPNIEGAYDVEENYFDHSQHFFERPRRLRPAELSQEKQRELALAPAIAAVVASLIVKLVFRSALAAMCEVWKDKVA